MKIFAFGSPAFVTSYWNGAATYYRGCYKYLARLGYDVTFAEPDAYGRQAASMTRTIFPTCDRSCISQPRSMADAILTACWRLAAQADIVVKHSGIGCDDAELERRVPAECSRNAGHDVCLGCRCAGDDRPDARSAGDGRAGAFSRVGMTGS